MTKPPVRIVGILIWLKEEINNRIICVVFVIRPSINHSGGTQSFRWYGIPTKNYTGYHSDARWNGWELSSFLGLRKLKYSYRINRYLLRRFDFISLIFVLVFVSFGISAPLIFSKYTNNYEFNFGWIYFDIHYKWVITFH